MKKYEFTDVSERNKFIEDCYKKGIKYIYHNADSCGVYHVETEETSTE